MDNSTPTPAALKAGIGYSMKHNDSSVIIGNFLFLLIYNDTFLIYYLMMI